MKTIKIINAKIVNNQETPEEIKKQRDEYRNILKKIDKEIKEGFKGFCNTDDLISYLNYLLEDFEREEK